MAALADLAARRPAALLVPAVAAVAVLVALAAGAPDRLAAGSTRPGAERDLVIVARGPFPATSPVYRSAIETILTGVRAQPDVAAARLGPARGERASIRVTLAPSDERADEDAAGRLAAEIDPGPLTLDYGGGPRVLVDARDSLAGQLWRLELVALPLVLLVAIWILGPAGAVAAAIAAVGAIAAALVALRLGSALGGASLLGIAPAAVIAPALAIELTALYRGILRRAAPGRASAGALGRALDGWVGPALAQTAVAALIPVALAAGSLPATGSIVLATAAACIVAAVLVAVVAPPLVALESRPLDSRATGPTGAGAPARPGRLARSPTALAAAVLAALAVPLALAIGSNGLETRPLAAVDLPAGSEALVAARAEARFGAAEPAPARATGEAVDDLALAGAVAVVGLGLALVALVRSPRSLVAVPAAVLPAAAALGAATLVIADGHLAAALGLSGHGALDTGAVICAATAVVAIGAGRSARDCLAVWRLRRRNAEVAAAVLAADLILPAAAAASLVGAAACGALVGADLYPAREFGLIVAAGLVIDLLLRPLTVIVLARLAPADPTD